MLKNIALSIALVSSLGAVGCTQTETAVTGAALGGAAGAAAAGRGNRVEGALIGAAAGGVAGTFIGRNRNNECVYRDANGREFVDACPR